MADPADRLARQLLLGVEHLRAGRMVEACTALTSVTADADLAAADDLRDVRARALTLLSDAQLQTGALEAATASLEEAERLVRALEDPTGLAEIHELSARVRSAHEARRQAQQRQVSATRLREMAVEDLRARLEGQPERLTDALIKKANAHADASDDDIAVTLSRQALSLARNQRSVRLEVLARLSLARADPVQAPEQLHAAWRAADRAGEPTLVTTVARAATAQGVDLPVQAGPELASGRRQAGVKP